MGNVRNEWPYVVQCFSFKDITVFLGVHKLLINSNIYIQQDATLNSLFYLETALHVQQ